MARLKIQCLVCQEEDVVGESQIKKVRLPMLRSGNE